MYSSSPALRYFLLSIAGSAAIVFLSGCATPYQPMSALGGYREIQLAPNIYRVMFFGNGYTNGELAIEYALRRCAELTQQNGCRYFGILGVADLSTQSSVTIPGSAYTTGTLNINQIGGTAFGTYNQRTFITPAQTLEFDFPRPVITIQMVNGQIPGATLFDAGTVLANRLPGGPNTNPGISGSYSTENPGPRLDQDPKLRARVIAFVKEMVASGCSGSSLPSPISFYAPNVVYNGKQVGRDFIARQIEFAFTTFPQRSAQLVSGPTISPPQNSGGCTVNYEVVAILRNSHRAFQATVSSQLNVELHGDQLSITNASPRILHPHAIK